MWPTALVEEIAARRCIIFLGSGASAGSKLVQNGVTKSPPTWKEFLERLAQSANLSPEVRPTFEDLIQKERYLDAAEVLISVFPVADFAAFIRNELAFPRYSASEVHKSVLNLDPKLVITTNYDDIYDRYCTTGAEQGLYNVCRYYESHLVDDLRSPVRQIIKAHGCISNPAKIVLTRSQFFKERQEYANFYKVLDALFLTNTLFFVGYGLSDPDIQLLLENSNITYKANHPHYAFIPKGMDPIIKKAIGESYNLHFIEFTKDNYDEANEMLAELVDMVASTRQRNPI